jgi:hypothetical protein
MVNRSTIPPLPGERVGVRANVSNTIFTGEGQGEGEPLFHHGKWLMLLLLLLFPIVTFGETKIRFEAVDIFIDAGTQPLAAYQLEFRVKNGGARIVGVEGGTSPAFNEPPFYDPKAMQKERVIIAAFSTLPAKKLPKDKIRVATIHLELRGNDEPEVGVKLQIAASPDGEKITAEASVERKPK